MASGKCYVGQAADISERWCAHRTALARGDHHASKLQRAWDKYGPDAFEFQDLELIEIPDGLSRAERREFLTPYEQYHMDRCPELLYNTAPAAGSNLGFNHSEDTKTRMSAAAMGNQNGLGNRSRLGHTVTPETRAKISATGTGIGRGVPLSPEHRAKLSASHMGHVPTPEHKANISAALKGVPWSPARRAAEEARQQRNADEKNKVDP